MKILILNLIVSLIIVSITLFIAFLSSTKNKYSPPILSKIKQFRYKKKNELSLILQNSYEGICKLDRNQKYVMVNKCFCDMTDYKENEIIDKKWPFSVSSDDIMKAKLAFIQTKENGKDVILIKLHSKQNKEFFKEISLYSIRNFLGYFKGCYIFVRDTLESKITNELGLLADSMPQICAVLELGNENIIYYNQKWYDYSGKSYEEMRNLRWKDFIHQDDIDEYIKLWDTSLKLGEPHQTKLRIKDKNSNYKWFFVRLLPIKNRNQKIIRWFKIATDIDDSMREGEIFK